MVKRKYILSVVAAALLAASPLSFAAPFGTLGTYGPNPGVGRAFNSAPGPFGSSGRMFGIAPGAGTPMFSSPGVGSSWIGSVGSTLPGSSSIGSVGSMPGSSSYEWSPGGSIVPPGIGAFNPLMPGEINPSPTCMPGLAANPC